MRVPDLAASIIPADTAEKKRRLTDDEILMKFMNYIFIPSAEQEVISVCRSHHSSPIQLESVL